MCHQAASKLEVWLWERLGQEWIRTTEGVKPADLQYASLRGKCGYVGQKRPKRLRPFFWFQLGASIPMTKTKDWPRVRKGLNGAGAAEFLRKQGKEDFAREQKTKGSSNPWRAESGIIADLP